MTAIQTLHILNKSPDHPRATRCLEMVAEEDCLLLIGGGVLLLALTQDLDARGLANLAGNVSAVDYAEMVSLSVQAKRVISW